MDQISKFDTPEILALLRRRDRQVWEELYESQWDPVCAFIRTKLRHSPNSQMDAEEIAQEVFVRAYSGITHFRGEARLATWLKSIAHHAIVDSIRTANVRERLIHGAPTLDLVRDALHSKSPPDPEAQILRKDRWGKLRQELHTALGPYCRVFTKRYLEELSEQQVAEAEGLKRGTASGYLSRARTILSQQRARFASFL
jgi:RNA polymerase sigma-70 factor, ECF subfamily